MPAVDVSDCARRSVTPTAMPTRIATELSGSSVHCARMDQWLPKRTATSVPAKTSATEPMTCSSGAVGGCGGENGGSGGDGGECGGSGGLKGGGDNGGGALMMGSGRPS